MPRIWVGARPPLGLPPPLLQLLLQRLLERGQPGRRLLHHLIKQVLQQTALNGLVTHHTAPGHLARDGEQD